MTEGNRYTRTTAPTSYYIGTGGLATTNTITVNPTYIQNITSGGGGWVTSTVSPSTGGIDWATSTVGPSTSNSFTWAPSEISWRLVDEEVNQELLDAIAGYRKRTVEVIPEDEEKKFTPPTEEELFDFLGFGGGESTE